MVSAESAVLQFTGFSHYRATVLLLHIARKGKGQGRQSFFHDLKHRCTQVSNAVYRPDYTEDVGEQGASREGQLIPQRTVQLLYQEKRKGLRLLFRKGTEGRDRGLRWQTNRGQDAFTGGRSAGKAETRGKLRARLARGARRRLPRGGWGSGPRRHRGLRRAPGPAGASLRPRPGPALRPRHSAGPRRAMAERSGARVPRAGGALVGGGGGPAFPPPLTPLSPLSAVPGAGPQGPPGSRAAAPGPLECRRCRYLCTARACCQVVGALLAALLLVCGSVSYGSTGGYTGVASLGGIHYYQYGGAYSGFSGADGEKARQLDQRFHLLKLPIARAAMAVGGSLTVFSCLLILFGVLRLPWHFPAWLLLECTLDAVVAIGLVPALYYFFHHLLEVYNSSVCKEREQLYQSKGYQGFRCSLHGAEIAAGLLGCTAVMAYLLSAGLAVKGYRTVRKLKQKPVQVYEL
ncbi:MARVEL domain-containing protein 3 [Mergus octosetaceus]